VIETYDRCVPGADATPSGMISPGAVTALALQVRKRRVGVRALSVRRAENEQHVFAVMAVQTSVGTFGNECVSRRRQSARIVTGGCEST
jgi:hypothetical protein